MQAGQCTAAGGTCVAGGLVHERMVGRQGGRWQVMRGAAAQQAAWGRDCWLVCTVCNWSMMSITWFASLSVLQP
jgi:hypothetical protein